MTDFVAAELFWGCNGVAHRVVIRVDSHQIKEHGKEIIYCEKVTLNLKLHVSTLISCGRKRCVHVFGFLRRVAA